MELLDSNISNKGKSLNIKKQVGSYLRLWPWILLSMLLFYVSARIYLHYTIPQYLTKSSLKLNQSKNTNTTLSDMKSLGMGINDDDELQGETTVIVSKPILTSVVENLKLNVSFFSKGKILELEIYKDSPLSGKIISINEPHKFSGASYLIEPVGKNQFKLLNQEGVFIGVFPLNAPAKLPFGTVQIDAKPGSSFSTQLKVVFSSIASSVAKLESGISVNVPENKGRLMELSLIGPVPQKSEDILNELSKQYNNDGIRDKNQEAQNTKDFINGRLEIISSDLAGIENQKEGFKRQNQITDLEAQANMALSNANDNTKSILNYSTQLDILNSVAKVANSSTDQLLPSNIGLSSGIETNISKYNELLLTRNRLLKQATGANPSVIEMNRDISSLKGLIRKNLSEAQQNYQQQISQVQSQINLDKEKISRYPTQEKVFRSIERQQNLKEQLYLYLLQKREENSITLAANADKAKVVNPAYTVGKVKPNTVSITNGALAVGFLLPLLFFFVKNTIDTKVHTKEHIISHIPDASVLAEIPVNEEDYAVVHPNDFSIFAESFRILVSNLKFMLKAKNPDGNGVILVTSSIKGEGKTTIAMNTALTLAGKNKVLILGADIRNPQLNRFVNGKNIGLTDYLVSDDNSPEKFINPSKLSKNLDIMFSGAIAPNPNDLLDMKKFDEMIETLKKSYDYVVVDSAPVMLVSDTLHLIENADAIVYVVKSDFTEKEMLDFAADFCKNNNVRNLAFVLNAVKPENMRYGKKYGYGYYSYGSQSEKKGLRKLF